MSLLQLIALRWLTEAHGADAQRNRQLGGKAWPPLVRAAGHGAVLQQQQGCFAAPASSLLLCGLQLRQAGEELAVVRV